MKNIFYSIFIIFFVACSNNDEIKNNPNIPDYNFNTGSLINTDLPQFSQLKFANNYITLYDSFGVNGIVLYHLGGEQYVAYELTDPNHTPNSCSTLTVEGIIATCSCDDGNSYEILGGLGREGTTGEYTLKPYFTETSGSIIRIFNN